MRTAVRFQVAVDACMHPMLMKAALPMRHAANGHMASLVVALFFLSLSVPLHAHNGAVAVAVPVEGISIDGDLSDWPDGMTRYAIAIVGGGPAPETPDDCAAHFRVGYNSREDALYVGVEVQDDDIVLEHPKGQWYRDQCEVFLDIEHVNTEVLNVVQVVMRGKASDVRQNGKRAGSEVRQAVEVSAHRGTRLHTYGMTLGGTTIRSDRWPAAGMAPSGLPQTVACGCSTDRNSGDTRARMAE